MITGERIYFYVREGQRHKGLLLYEWLLRQARSQGFSGGTAIQSLAGFGRHGWHEAHFFEEAGELPVLCIFVGTPEQMDALVQDVSDAGLSIFYSRHPVHYGITGQ
jgi:PII-like signaling protein